MTALDVNKKSIVYEIKTLQFDHPLFKDFLINISYKETGSKSCTHFVYFGFGSGYKHIGWNSMFTHDIKLHIITIQTFLLKQIFKKVQKVKIKWELNNI